MTFPEFRAAVNGHLMANGIDPAEPAGGMSRARLEELKAQYPDG